jgi:hypothetical protein
MRAEEFTPDLFASLDPRLETLTTDLLWWTNTLRVGRDNLG